MRADFTKYQSNNSNLNRPLNFIEWFILALFPFKDKDIAYKVDRRLTDKKQKQINVI